MTDKPMVCIRRGNVYDLFALELLLAKGLEESNGLLPDYDQLPTLHKALDLLHGGLVFNGGSVFVACEINEAAKRERIVGCIALNLEAFSWNSSVRVLRSVHFYVLPEARAYTIDRGNTLVFEGLRAAGCALADAAQLPLIIEQLHQVGPDNRAEAKDELFARTGMSYVGGSFVYMPQPAQETKAA